MRRATRWPQIALTTLACILVTASVAAADSYKNESGKNKERSWRESPERGFAHDSGDSFWSVGGTWVGEQGAVSVVVGSEPTYSPHYGYVERPGRHRRSWRIPAGHLPPPGQCRVWMPGRPAGHQPPPTRCGLAERYAHRYGGRVIYGGPR